MNYSNKRHLELVKDYLSCKKNNNELDQFKIDMIEEISVGGYSLHAYMNLNTQTSKQLQTDRSIF